jgi:hypothetical protein
MANSLIDPNVVFISHVFRIPALVVVGGELAGGGIHIR